MTTYRIIWPDRRTVSADQIKMWFGDALEDGRIEDEGKLYKEYTVDEMARALDNIGFITLGR